jgi:hypothetical protein
LTIKVAYFIQNHRFRQLLALVALLACTISANAVVVSGLYEVSYPVASQQVQERKAAIKHALVELLIRVTGNSQIMEMPQAAQMLEKAPGYVRQFRYAFETVMQHTGDPGFSETQKEQQVLNVLFDEAAIKQALWKNKLPVWGKTRPATIVWIAIQDAERRYLLDSNVSKDIVDVINTQAKKRGIPVIYPLLDLEDQMNINVSDVWGGFADNIANASSRYPAEEIFSGRVFLDPFGTWQARWTLLHGSEQTVWQVSGEELETVIELGVHGLADNVAARYASTATDEAQEGLRIQIANVGNIKALVKTTKYLESLSQIAKIHLAKVESKQVTYQIELRTDQESLTRAISLGRTLAQDPNAVGDEPSLLAYRLVQ